MTEGNVVAATGEGAPEGIAERRRTRDAYGAALGMVLLSVVVSIALGTYAAGVIAVGLLQGATLLLVLRVSGARPKVRLYSMTIAVVATLLAAGVTYFNAPMLQPVAPALWALIVAGAMGAILRRVSTYQEVNMQSVLGLLTFYLLLGILFGYVFAFAGLVGPFFAGGEKDHASYVYFSFVTLSTTGYGDLAPVAGAPRALAVAEAMFGQLYLVSVVSVAVSRIASSALVRR